MRVIGSSSLMSTRRPEVACGVSSSAASTRRLSSSEVMPAATSASACCRMVGIPPHASRREFRASWRRARS
jgi:hypothetical protein